ncbi:MAG TPA: DUF2130 domain-containing protein [Vicinamibacterales bacterium]|nr:DUF2130 domain-containing protein [Vicinamibacterales bacterium]
MDQTITCPDCGAAIPLTRALRADIESSLKREFERALAARERELQRGYDAQIEDARKAAQTEAMKKAERKLASDLADLKDQLREQAEALDAARMQQRDLRRRERELQKEKADLELTVARTLDVERARLVVDAQERVAEQHRLKDAEKDRQLSDLRRQIEDLRRKADVGSQQLQGEAGETTLESMLRARFPADEISGIGQGIRGADIHHTVVDPQGGRCGSVLWECKNTKHWSEAWIPKLKTDQRACRADVAVLVTAALPKACTRFTLIDGVIVAEFACAGAVAALVRAQLVQLSQARVAANTKEEKLELLYRYLSGIEFRQRVEAVVEAFANMRHELEQERRAAERQWSRRAKQLEAVTFNISGMYGDLQGLVALPPMQMLELPSADAEA